MLQNNIINLLKSNEWFLLTFGVRHQLKWKALMKLLDKTDFPGAGDFSQVPIPDPEPRVLRSTTNTTLSRNFSFKILFFVKRRFSGCRRNHFLPTRNADDFLELEYQTAFHCVQHRSLVSWKLSATLDVLRKAWQRKSRSGWLLQTFFSIFNFSASTLFRLNEFLIKKLRNLQHFLTDYRYCKFLSIFSISHLDYILFRNVRLSKFWLITYILNHIQEQDVW